MEDYLEPIHKRNVLETELGVLALIKSSPLQLHFVKWSP